MKTYAATGRYFSRWHITRISPVDGFARHGIARCACCMWLPQPTARAAAQQQATRRWRTRTDARCMDTLYKPQHNRAPH